MSFGLACKLRATDNEADPGGFIEGRVDLRYARQQQDGTKAQQNPDADETDRRECPVEVSKPGTGERLESDGLEHLVDQAREGQQPAPDDSLCWLLGHPPGNSQVFGVKRMEGYLGILPLFIT